MTGAAAGLAAPLALAAPAAPAAAVMLRLLHLAATETKAGANVHLGGSLQATAAVLLAASPSSSAPAAAAAAVVAFLHLHLQLELPPGLVVPALRLSLGVPVEAYQKVGVSFAFD